MDSINGSTFLAAQRAGSAIIKPIGEKWAYNFIKRHLTIQI
jgi:hypothetical protein